MKQSKKRQYREMSENYSPKKCDEVFVKQRKLNPSSDKKGPAPFDSLSSVNQSKIMEVLNKISVKPKRRSRSMCTSISEIAFDGCSCLPASEHAEINEWVEAL